MNKMRLELQIEGNTITGHEYEALKKLGEDSGKEWAIYIIKESRLHKLPHPKNPIFKDRPAPPRRIYKKMTDGDVMEAIRLLNKGYDPKVVRKKFHVGDDYLRKAIKEHKTQST